LKPQTAYQLLESRFRRINALGDAAAILQWDWATVMPENGSIGRGEQLAELKAVRHGIMCAPDMGELLDAADQDDGLDEWRQANLREMRRIWETQTALGEDLVAALSRAQSKCDTAWRKARAENDFPAVRPALEELLSLVREAAAAKSEKLGLDPYDALLNDHDPGCRIADIEPVLNDLEDFLPGFLQNVLDHQARKPAVRQLKGPFAEDKQRALGIRFMETLGFDFRSGRLDTSLHPFCGGTPDDVRITTRYDTDDFTSSLMGVLHETGHALYDIGLPKAWRGQPVGDALGMSMHESQSLLIEMQVCRSREFLEFAAPLMAAAFNATGPEWSVDNLCRLNNTVESGFIRVDADEVTYPLHVILRTRLERAMISGNLKISDLPGAWNDGMKQLLGLTPPNDSDGCLQDIHWFDGAWGYFPTYTLGAIMAAQIFDAARRADADIMPGIQRGDFAPLLNWICENIHSHGARYPTAELLERATGGGLNAGIFKTHLKNRYLS